VEATTPPEHDAPTTVSAAPAAVTAADAEADTPAPAGDGIEQVAEAPAVPKLSRQAQLQAQAQAVQPVLEKLFELYPQLFGAQFLPLKLGVFQELLARHPEDFQKDTLKLALGQHTRSTRYLQAVAAGMHRHDLDGQPVEPVAPEHVYLTMLEMFRRRQRNAREDLRPKFRAQLIAAFEASGLTRQDYIAKVQTTDEAATALLEEALAEHAEKLARQQALMALFDSSGKSPEEFADMYGMDRREVARALARRQTD
jgi:sRNA-binding protein